MDLALNKTSVTLRARWMIDRQGKAMEGVRLKVEQGRIRSLETGANSQREPSDVDLGDVCILPSLINSHTHLEFSDLPEPIPVDSDTTGNQSFCNWIGSVVRHRIQQRNALIEAGGEDAWIAARKNAYLSGMQESIQAGVGCLVDMVTMPWQPDWDFEQPMVVLPQLEVLGPTPERLEGSIANIEQWNQWSNSDLCNQRNSFDLSPFGIAPHAPYTTPVGLVERAIQLAKSNGWMMSMHLAESKEELAWLGRQSGPMEEMLSRIAASFAAEHPAFPNISDYIQAIGRAPRSLLIHGNYLSEQDIELLARYRETVAVVYCPRTHHFFGHNPHPWQALRAKGITVCLGTDSRASSPDLSILSEARELCRQTPSIDPADALSLITTAPASFLGVEAHAGSIALGTLFNRMVVPCTENDSGQVLESILFG